MRVVIYIRHANVFLGKTRHLSEQGLQKKKLKLDTKELRIERLPFLEKDIT
jgi:hypothetical protein